MYTLEKLNEVPEVEYFPEQQEVLEQAQRLSVMERIRNIGDGALAKVAVAAAFVGGTTATEMAANPNPVSADTAPTTVLTPEQQQQCIDDALKMPKITKAYVVHPGRRPFEHNPRVLGAVQTTVLRAEYSANLCPDVLRVGSAILEKEIAPDTWVNLYKGDGNVVWRYSLDRSGVVGRTKIESGHGEPDWVFLKPGEHERLVLKEVAKNANTRKTLGKKIRKYNIPTRWNT